MTHWNHACLYGDHFHFDKKISFIKFDNIIQHNKHNTNMLFKKKRKKENLMQSPASTVQ